MPIHDCDHCEDYLKLTVKSESADLKVTQLDIATTVQIDGNNGVVMIQGPVQDVYNTFYSNVIAKLDCITTPTKIDLQFSYSEG